MRDLFNSTAAEIYEMGDDTTALHLKLGMWHADLKSKGEESLLERLTIKNVLVPRQSLIFEIDPTNSRPLNEVRNDIWALAGAYRRLQAKGNREHESMTIDEILDLAEKFHQLEWKSADWSWTPWGCSCADCYKYLGCGHNTLMAMLFDPKLTVPKEKETAEPSMRKGRIMARGTAGQKRKRLLAAMRAEKKVGVKKGKRDRKSVV